MKKEENMKTKIQKYEKIKEISSQLSKEREMKVKKV